MTFQRVLNRNGLADGDYDKLPTAFPRVHTDPIGPDGFDRSADLAPFWRKQTEAYEATMRTLAGDLRRLEKDAVDENAICNRISERIGVDVDTVAAVLKEFIAW